MIVLVKDISSYVFSVIEKYILKLIDGVFWFSEMDHACSDPEVYAPVNIGLPQGRPPRRAQLKGRLECIAELRKNKIKEKEARKGKCKVLCAFQ